MNDSRIAQARALIDDARVLLAELYEEGPRPKDKWGRHFLASSRHALNSAIVTLNALEESE